MKSGNTPATASKSYRVEWAIDIEGVTSPEEAARKAWEHMRRYDSTANVFTAYAEDGAATKVDLQELEEAGDVSSLAYLGGIVAVAQAVRDAVQLAGATITENGAVAAAQAVVMAAQGALKSSLEMLLDHALPDNWRDTDDLAPERVEAWRNALTMLGRLPPSG